MPPRPSSPSHRALVAATGERRIVCERHGGDAIWRAPRAGETAATVAPQARARVA